MAIRAVIPPWSIESKAVDPSLAAAEFIDQAIVSFYRLPPEPIRVMGLDGLGIEWLRRAQAKLLRRFESELTGKRPRITTEEAAMAMLKGASLELETAGKALDAAAEQLRDLGKGHLASQAKQAASQARAAAGELVPS